MFKSIDETLLVAPQITVADVAAAKAQGVTLIVNNRPDGEDPAAPQGDEIAAAARAAGVRYVAIPVSPAGIGAGEVAAMADALAGAGGRTLAYCRSGTRSTHLWALARASRGAEPDALVAAARAAGYDLAALKPRLDALAAE